MPRIQNANGPVHIITLINERRCVNGNSPSTYQLASAGYLILGKAEDAAQTNDYWRDFGLYLAWIGATAFSARPVIRQAIGDPLVEDPELRDLLEEWFDSRYGNTAFIPDRSQALRLLRGFCRFGFQFELVFRQLGWTVGEETRLDDYANTQQTPPNASVDMVLMCRGRVANIRRLSSQESFHPIGRRSENA